MKVGETKQEAFTRVATKRTNRILKDVSLLGNLSDKRNYRYERYQVEKIFRAIDAELREAKVRFNAALKRERKIKL